MKQLITIHSHNSDKRSGFESSQQNRMLLAKLLNIPYVHIITSPQNENFEEKFKKMGFTDAVLVSLGRNLFGDSEIYFLGRAGEKTCNNNFQVEYNSKINQFYFRIRKEIDLEDDKFVYGQFNFNNKIYTNLLKNLLRTKESALTYRIKVKDNKVLLQISYNFEHNKDLCVTRNSYGVIGVDFNKGFVSVSETDKYGNLINTFNIDYQYSKGNKTTNDFQYIATKLKDYCLNTGKDLVIEKLDFNKKRDNLISQKGKKYNEMLSSLAYSKFGSIITSKCAKNRIFLHKVNPAWTSWIAKQKYCPKMKLNIHSGASYVIARRGMLLKDKAK